jgi:hypothetical protein
LSGKGFGTEPERHPDPQVTAYVTPEERDQFDAMVA